MRMVAAWDGRRGVNAVWTQQKYELQSSMGEILSRLGEVIAAQRRYVGLRDRYDHHLVGAANDPAGGDKVRHRRS